MIGILLLKQIYGLSDEGVWDRWVQDPYFQYFTSETFFQHKILHERSGLSHWRCRLGDRLELLLAESLRVAHSTGALKAQDMERVTVGAQVPDPRCAGRSPGRPADRRTYSTVTLLARLRGWSTSVPFQTAA